MSKDTLVTVSEYAQLQGISRQAVLKRIKTKKLKARKIGNYWIIKLS